VVGIIGRNGAGKSTILKILSRITEPTDGFAVIKGRVGSLLEVGTGFHSELSGRENIYLNGAILGMRRSEIDQNFDEIVAFSEVEKFIDTPVKHYSSGMYLRLAFAVAAHLKPEILIVDEVLAVGDADFQKKCLGKMNTVSKEGRTVLFVSHNMAAIANLCTRAILLQDGRVVMIGDTTEVIDTYIGRTSDLARSQLSCRKDRQGTGDIRVVAVELLNPEKNCVANGISGKELTIRMHYKALDGRVFKSCRAAVAVTKNQQLYFNLSTELVETQQLVLSGEGYIDFVIPELPLSHSTYMIHTYVESNNEVMDWVSDAAEMCIIDGDYYGTGRNYPANWRGGMGVLVKFHWNHKNV
jgi:lipopolysaccharide transport system ATP-binding protein